MDSNSSKKIKLLYLVWDKFPPFRVDVSVLFGKELAQRGYQIDFLLQSEADNKAFYVENWSNSKAYVGPTDNGTTIINRFLKQCLDLLNDLRMIKLVKEQKYDFIQVKDKFISAIIALIVAKIANLHFLFWLSYPFPESDIYEYHTRTARYPILYLIRGIFRKFFLYRVILPFSHHIFVQSDQMKKDIVSKGFPQAKLTPVPMGVDIDDFIRHIKNPSKKYSSTNDLIIYIGEMEKMRKIDFILRVFQKVLFEIPTSKLLMVGGSYNDSDIDDLKQEAKELRIDHAVTFTGNLPRAKALDFVKMADIGLSPIAPNPIYIPSSPTKIIEYMLLGKPVVANDIPEQKKVLTESKAGYCVSYDENAFAEAIIKIIRNPSEAKRMGDRGIEYVKLNRSYKKIADIVDEQYNKLTS